MASAAWWRPTAVKLALVVLCATISSALAASSSGLARLEIGEKETIKSLAFAGPARKADRKRIVTGYRFITEPKNVVSFAFVETHLDGTVKVTPVSDGNGQHTTYGQMFAGQLDLRITRLTDDVSFPIAIRVVWYTRNEGEPDFPK